MKTSRSLIGLSAAVSFAFSLSTPSAGSADLAETLGKAGARATAMPLLRDATREADDYYTYHGGRISLARSLDVVGVRFVEGVTPERAGTIVRNAEAAASVELAGRAPTRGVSLVRVRKPAEKGSADVAGGDQTRPVLESLRASVEVLYAFPVLVNPATGNRLLLTDEVVARLRPGVTVAAVTAVHGLVEVERLWGTLDEHLFRLGDPKSQDPLETANRLAASDLVLWAEPNFVQQYDLEATPNDPSYPSQWHLNNTGQGGGTPDADVDAPEAWDTTTGSSSVVIAIIDDGVEATHEDLSSRIFVNPGEIAGDGIDNDGNGYVDDVKGWDFSNNDADPSPMDVDDNHGTAVAGVAAATGNNGLGVTGACQSCRILPVKVFSPDFVGDAAAANAIRYAASFADVLNNSWGGGSPSAAIQSAIQWAIANGRGGKGSAVFFASGNSAGAWIQFSLGGIPAGTHRFRWRYMKDASVSSGEDTAWLGWVEFPGGERVDFESGSLPAGFSTSGNANWSVVSNPDRADEGWCLTKSAKAGTITHSQSTYLEAVKTVPAGTLLYKGWVSSEGGYDIFDVFISLNDTGTFLGPYLRVAGVPYVDPAVGYPAAHPESIAVGAVTDLGCRSAYSQYGPELAVVAPSNGGASGITTTDRTGSAGYNTSGAYYSGFGGTSSATPLTSGVAGLVLSADSSLTEAQVRATLQSTADKVGPEPYVAGRNDRYGYGKVNAQAAVSEGGATIDPTSAGFGAGGGSGTVTVTASAGHAWTAVSNVVWITITSGASGNGNGTVEYLVAANAGTSRTGTMTIAGWTFTVNQAGACTASISPTSASLPTAGGTGQVTVTATAGCSWTAASNDTWLVVTGGASGTGNGTVDYSAAANSGGPRTGTITIAWQTFTVTQAGVQFTDIGANLQGLDGSAVAWGDYDNDGDLDLLATGCSMTASGNGCYILNSKVYRNDGGGVFTLAASPTGVTGGSVAWGDYDRDGDLDFALSGCDWTGIYGCYRGVTKAYRNDGGVFTDAVAGLPAEIYRTLAWGDYDNDGDLDLLAGSKLFRNDGGGVFSNVWTGSGARSAWGDYDNDGDLDILMISSGSPYVSTVYRNDGGGAFTDAAAGLVGVGGGFVAWGDYDNDGDLDILLSGSTASTPVSKVYRNDGAGAFTGVWTGPSGAAAWGDYDNDGDLDFLCLSKVYRNDGGAGFVDAGVTLPSGATSPTSVAWGDYENDGDLDILLSGSLLTRVYRNDGTTANTVPSAPTGLSGVGGSLSWAASTDAQTPAAGLTYNLRVGTTPGGVDVLSPMASTSTGYRRVAQLGNANHGATAFLAGLSPGTYYWGVQAIDTAFAGSAFSSESTFSICTTTLTPPGVAVGAGGSTGSVNVTMVGTCAWTAVSNDAWITVTAGATGSGSGVVDYAVAANTGIARTGTIAIAGLTFTVNQASGCTYAIDPTSATYGSAGGSGTVDVGTGAGCGWTAASNDAWVTVTGGSSGTGGGTVSYSATANAGPVRTGTMTIAGLMFTVDQASGCTYALDPTSATFGLGGGTGNVSVTTAAGCAWTAASNDGWITVTGGSSGTGDGTVSYSVAVAGDARTGTMTIAGQTFTVIQSDRLGFYTVTPCRAFDSRLLAFGPALSAGETRLVALGGVCEVPTDASAVSFNVTVAVPGAQGHLRIFPAGGTLPGIATINYNSGQTRANNGIVVLGTSGQIAVYCKQASGSTHVIVDVNGYFVEE